MLAAVVTVACATLAAACSRADAGAPHGESVPAPAGAPASAGAAGPAPGTSAGATGTAVAASGGSEATSAAGSGATASAPAASAEGGQRAWAARLPPVLFRDINARADVTVRLYRDDGTIDGAAVAEVERVLWAAKDGDAPHVSRRLLQLVVKAAARFDAREVEVISSHRGKARRGSKHRTGEAIDFVFPGVPPKTLAEHLRTFARVGVGTYVHPRSQFVHLDVREQSYHWIDGSPPGRTWREHPLPDPTSAARDAAYEPGQDLPIDLP